jgi:hypothetical protein
VLLEVTAEGILSVQVVSDSYSQLQYGGPNVGVGVEGMENSIISTGIDRKRTRVPARRPYE